MALIDCPGCGKKVSDGSPYCPECGQPIPRKLAPFETDPQSQCKRRWKFSRNGFLTIFVFLLVYGLSGVFLETHRVSSWTPIFLFMSLIGVVVAILQLKKYR
ncbi:MAG: zinc ribbon domain-containing protein [Candidatus Omnitrophica bacterium]|nr:zinc ribbon domain-containing protein [Candidatus Omnitrophota bacterium]MCA9426029.1 zinc ribbon domain-containing protein [Candidatus Omnitrophota bacterium]MCA9430790.1 zinc ribbon domain-containing protein [Candidatus Omnitrophota bacterium]MCA9438223.1 zinc ribbon domain-containing protein [Candidatus Omnitrophota bacterium]MCA9444328.1 zinc ribbon domain-containing protein [Candidatus Omnitrophota bacterium]